jgi:hypothetical protein
VPQQRNHVVGGAGSSLQVRGGVGDGCVEEKSSLEHAPPPPAVRRGKHAVLTSPKLF